MRTRLRSSSGSGAFDLPLHGVVDGEDVTPGEGLPPGIARAWRSSPEQPKSPPTRGELLAQGVLLRGHVEGAALPAGLGQLRGQPAVVRLEDPP